MKRLVSPPFTFLALLMLAWALASCRPDAAVHDALVRAEALMESDPHAARALLDSLARATSPRQLGIRNEELKNNPADENPADESHAQPVIPNSSFLIPNFPRKGDRLFTPSCARRPTTNAVSGLPVQADLQSGCDEKGIYNPQPVINEKRWYCFGF